MQNCNISTIFTNLIYAVNIERRKAQQSRHDCCRRDLDCTCTSQTGHMLDMVRTPYCNSLFSFGPKNNTSVNKQRPMTAKYSHPTAFGESPQQRPMALKHCQKTFIAFHTCVCKWWPLFILLSNIMSIYLTELENVWDCRRLSFSLFEICEPDVQKAFSPQEFTAPLFGQRLGDNNELSHQWCVELLHSCHYQCSHLENW